VAYVLKWYRPGTSNPKVDITVPVGSTVAGQASLKFTGKGAANYGEIQQENLLWLLENFSGETSPEYPTLGQIWYDSLAQTLKVCISDIIGNIIWEPVSGIPTTEPGEPPPAIAALGSVWFQRTGTSSGIMYVFDGIGRFPAAPGVNGGWNQVWPEVDNSALRAEYDEAKLLADLLLGPTTDPSYGNDTFGRLFPDITDFATLDADLSTKIVDLGSDPNVVVGADALAQVEVQPFSHDWDYFLSAARWGVHRLDLPADTWQDISDIPFVQDGRQAPTPLLTSYPTADPRYPTADRRAVRRYGSVTTTRLFAETMNVLSTAGSMRYTLRGTMGGSGANPSFSSDVVGQQHCIRRAGPPSGPVWPGGSTPVDVTATLRWTDNLERNRFWFSGSIVEIVLDYTIPGAPTASDTAWLAFVNTYKRVRINGDGIFAFGNTTPITLAVAPSSNGFKYLLDTSGTVTLATYSTVTGTVVVTASNTSGLMNLNLALSETAAGVLTGTTTVTYNLIRDRTVFNDGVADNVDLFPAPFAWVNSTDGVGTSPLFIDVPVTPAPVVDFTVAPRVGVTDPATEFSFQWSGTPAAPTLIEWDFDGDGVYTTVGPAPTNKYYSPGLKTIRVRATTDGGQDVLTRVGYLSITGDEVAPPPIPVPSFTVSPNPATVGAIITLTDTSSNSPTLINWDTDGDGNYDATGATTTVTYGTTGTKVITMEASNIHGAATTTRTVTVAAAVIPDGEALFTTAGSFSWTAPAGVTSVSAVVIGGGGAWTGTSLVKAGGGGGGLAWRNNIPVIPGNVYPIVVGGTAGTSSFNTTLIALGGSNAVDNTRGVGGAPSGTYDGGGIGGNGGTGFWTEQISYGCGGGTAGYAGYGGAGAAGPGSIGYHPEANSGGAAGGGGSSLANSQGGGGVGLYGIGPNGTASGQGGSGGTNGVYGTINAAVGGAQGGGAGGGTTTGATGGVRIIWGTGRSYPSNAAAPLSITTHPATQSVSEGASVTFTVTVMGTAPITYQWQRSSDGTTFTNIGGATGATYTFATTLADNGFYYRAVVTNPTGFLNSNSARLTVVQAVFLTPITVLGGEPYSTISYNVVAEIDVSSSIPVVETYAYPTPSSLTVTVNSVPVPSMVWNTVATSRFNLSPIPANLTYLSNNGQAMVITTANAAGTVNRTLTINVLARTKPSQFVWASSGSATATIARNSVVTLRSVITGNLSNPRATSIAITAGTVPPGFSLVSVTDWNAGAANTNAVGSGRVRIGGGTVTVAGTYNFTLSVVWSANSCVAPLTSTYNMTLTVT